MATLGSRPRRTHAAGPRHIFFHMPKTAGQTLINLISREYRGHVMDTKCAPLVPEVWERFVARIAATPEDELRQNQALTGRMKFGAHALFPGPSRYVTFVRDPIKRFVSFYNMTKRLRMIPPDHAFDLSRPDWNRPTEGWFTREIDNGQVRALADADWELPFGACGEAHYQAALANLDKYFIFVGLTDRFDLSLMMLSRICGWRTHYYVAKNVAPRGGMRDRMAPEILTAIGELNSFDRRLYAHLKDRFEDQVRAEGAALQIRYKYFRAANALHGNLHQLTHPPRASK